MGRMQFFRGHSRFLKENLFSGPRTFFRIVSNDIVGFFWRNRWFLANCRRSSSKTVVVDSCRHFVWKAFFKFIQRFLEFDFLRLKCCFIYKYRISRVFASPQCRFPFLPLSFHAFSSSFISYVISNLFFEAECTSSLSTSIILSECS